MNMASVVFIGLVSYTRYIIFSFAQIHIFISDQKLKLSLPRLILETIGEIESGACYFVVGYVFEKILSKTRRFQFMGTRRYNILEF
jgi:hypothetical protein